LKTDHLDILLLHRPDTLMEPEEVAEAFDSLQTSGKVRYFGVSNHNLFQMELLKTAVKQPLIANQLQVSITESGMMTSGMNVNMKNEESVLHDGGLLEYCRIKKITIQTWSPFQFGFFGGNFVGNREKFPKLNEKLDELAQMYQVSPTAIAAAWLLRHPADMQVIAGTMNPSHLKDICRASDLVLTRSQWYDVYLSAGHCLP
jgi:predicted oxidoreductase